MPSSITLIPQSNIISCLSQHFINEVINMHIYTYMHACMHACLIIYYFRNPVATIQKSVEGLVESAPFVVSFSSRGPNPITKNILKVRNSSYHH